jgi:hypothetical protein
MIKSVILHTPVANSYLRNNRSTRQKSLRCFPMCSSKGHVNGGFCGQSLRATIVLGVENNDITAPAHVPFSTGAYPAVPELPPLSSTIMPYPDLQSSVTGLTEAGETKKDLFDLNDFIIIMEIRPVLNPRISGKQFINKQEIHNQLRTKHEKSSLEKELFMGEADLVATDPEKKELKLFVVFNPNHSSWDYSWKSNRWSGPNEQHVVDIIVLKYYSTTDFQVYSHYVSNPFIVVSSHKKGLPGTLKGTFDKSKSQSDFMYTVEAGEQQNGDNEGEGEEPEQNEEKEDDLERAPSGHEDPYDKPIALPSSVHQTKKRKLKELSSSTSTLITLPSSTSTTAVPQVHHQIILPNGIIEREKRINMRNIKQTLILDPNFVPPTKPLLKQRKVSNNSDKGQEQVVLPKKFPSEPNFHDINKPKQTNKGHAHDDMNDVFEASQLLSNLSAKPYIPMVIDLPKKNLQPLESIPLTSLSILPATGDGFDSKLYSPSTDSNANALNDEKVIFSTHSKDFSSGTVQEKTMVVDDAANSPTPAAVVLSTNGKNQSNIVGSMGSNSNSNSGYDSAGGNIDTSFTKFKDSLAHMKHLRKLRRTQYRNHPQLPVKEALTPGTPGGPLTVNSFAGDNSEDDIENSAHQLLLLSTKSSTIANNNTSSSDLPLYDHLQHLAHHPFLTDSDSNRKIVLKSKSTENNDNIAPSRTPVSLYSSTPQETETPGAKLLTIHPMLSVAPAANKPFMSTSSSSAIPKQLPHYRQICLPSAGQTYEEERAKAKKREAAARAREEAEIEDFNTKQLFLPLKTTSMTNDVVRIAGSTTSMGLTMRQLPEDQKLVLPKKNVNG